MTARPGEVWDHRLIRPGEYVVRCDGVELVHVSMTGISQQSMLIRKIVAVFAGPAPVTPIVWAELGWASKAEHDAMFAEVRLEARSHRPAVRRYVTAERKRRGLPPIPPYTVDQLDVLDQIIRTAPAIVDQDEAAEGTAA